MQCIDQTFAYYITRKLSIDNSKIKSTIDIYLDREVLYDYACYGSKYIGLMVNRVNVELYKNKDS